MCFQFGVNCPECGKKISSEQQYNVSVGSNRVVLLPFYDPIVKFGFSQIRLGADQQIGHIAVECRQRAHVVVGSLRASYQRANRINS